MFNVSCDYIFFKVFFLGRNSLMAGLRILFQNACGYPLWALARICQPKFVCSWETYDVLLNKLQSNIT